MPIKLDLSFRQTLDGMSDIDLFIFHGFFSEVVSSDLILASLSFKGNGGDELIIVVEMQQRTLSPWPR